ncbi:hypothetical protein [Pseudoalteromonas luteoviolacea]|nr:hypothetical protein [Pseudoalteromonas luteoviolacea]
MMIRCPICREPSGLNTEREVCRECVKKAVNREGRKVKFYNEGMGGGYFMECQETGKRSEDPVCYISNVKCVAGERRRFGGIRVETYESWNKTYRYSHVEPSQFVQPSLFYKLKNGITSFTNYLKSTFKHQILELLVLIFVAPVLFMFLIRLVFY